MKRFSHFIDFTSEEFATNESFQSYVFRSDEEAIAYWEAFIQQHPEKLAEIQEASRLLSVLTFRHSRIKAQDKLVEVNRLLSSIAQHEGRADRTKIITRLSHRSWWPKRLPHFPLSRMVVAAATIVVACCLWLYLPTSLDAPGDITYQTQYGENATYILPDSSVVTLNGNSRLILKKGWHEGALREVWLDGEAFFDVKHKSTNTDARFIVHIPGLEVEVLGTKFNVFNREDKANIILNKGKVKVRMASKEDTSSVVMMPDEALEFSRKELTMTKRQVKAEVLTSWRNRVLIFENTTLSRIAEIIEHTYGVKIVFTEDVDTSEKLTGTVPSEKLETLLNVLAISSNLHIERQQNQITISKHDPKSKNH